MAGRERDWDENAHGSPDPETLYTKEYCIGSSHASWPSPGRKKQLKVRTPGLT